MEGIWDRIFGITCMLFSGPMQDVCLSGACGLLNTLMVFYQWLHAEVLLSRGDVPDYD